MDLLLSIKQLYELLVELKIEEKIPTLSELEKIAVELYGGNVKKLNELLKLPLAPENHTRILEKVSTIKEIVSNEKNI